MRVVTVEQMRVIEAEAERRYGLDGPALMAHAGASAAAIAREWLGGSVLDTRWLMLVGPGNNGGDARVMTSHLMNNGATVTLFDWKAQQLQQLDEAGAVTTTADADDEALVAAIAEADVVVDALLGIGHSRPLSDSMIAVNKLVRSEYMRRKGRPRVIALDLPSGVNADTGAVDVGALAADMTITLACPKIGLLCYPGAAYVGELHTGSIGLPNEMDLGGVAEQITPEMIAELLPARPTDSHKGTYGKAAVLAGSPEFPGAALLAATAAGRIGAGLVTIATTPALATGYVGTLPEAVYILLPDDPIARAQAVIDGIREREIDALAIGPGLGQAAATVTMLLALLDRLRQLPDAQRPRLIVDADGLNILSRQPEWWKLLPPLTVLTPHPGEMARLMGGQTKVPHEGPERLELVRAQAQAWGHVLVLKGAITLIAGPDGEANARPWINYAPNPAMATAGAGDVLAGTIAGLLAQGCTPFAAAGAGVALHSDAGRLAAIALGDVRAGMLAGDIAQSLPDARALLEAAP